MNYSKEQLDQIFAKGDKVRGKDPDKYRSEEYGNKIYRQSNGKESPTGWEVDHSNPKMNGGTDCDRKLKPMQSSKNSRKRATYPYKKKFHP